MSPALPLDPIETASRDELAALQLERLKWSLNHAYENSPVYRRKFDEAGIHPSELKTLADLARFPFTTRKDLRDSYPFGMFAVPQERVSRIHASSGTTDKPTVVGYTARDIDTWANLIARSIRAAGAKPGDKVHVSYGYGLFTGGLGAHYGAERAGLTVIPFSGGQTEKQVQLIQDFRPDIIMVTPSYMLSIADELERQGIDPATCSLRIGIFGAEPWTNDMRQAIERRMGIDAVDIYGLSEVMGPGVASECVETKDGPTIWEDHFYPEIIDPETGEVLPDGELGELMFTSLTKEALPIIRYRTRDLTRLLPGSARTMRHMEKITGRSDDMMIVRGVNVFPTQIEELLLKQHALAPHYQIVLTKEGPLDVLTLNVEPCPETAPDATALSAAKQALAYDIKALIGVSAVVNVLPVNGIERSVGKVRCVVDKRKSGQCPPPFSAEAADKRLARARGAYRGNAARRVTSASGARVAIAATLTERLLPTLRIRQQQPHPATLLHLAGEVARVIAETPEVVGAHAALDCRAGVLRKYKAVHGRVRQRARGLQEHRRAKRNRGRIDGNGALRRQRQAKRADGAVCAAFGRAFRRRHPAEKHETGIRIEQRVHAPGVRARPSLDALHGGLCRRQLAAVQKPSPNRFVRLVVRAAKA
ncbi:MAG: Phenylacetate-coenzyme A ligase (EC [uncultured Paraburkholderia sp.]|nr:MAG: Phenylacetate-coenzyme A ligase (EC [uncultured Paraburkholderia sp.]